MILVTGALGMLAPASSAPSPACINCCPAGDSTNSTRTPSAQRGHGHRPPAGANMQPETEWRGAAGGQDGRRGRADGEAAVDSQHCSGRST
jgi:hypothetical protein